ncbi:MAG: CmcJ/NvfI family oxidoreductase [Hyphomicrobiaceae bacterium]
MNQHVPVAAFAAKPQQSDMKVSASLNFIKRQDTKPVFHSAALTGRAPEYLYETEAHAVTISNMREITENLSVDREGFELLRYATGVVDFYDDDAVKHEYLPETKGLLRRRFGANRVVIFDVTRRSDDGTGAKNPEGRRGPASQLHVDYTAKSGPQRVRDVLGAEEADRLASSGARIVQINVWRPIRGPVERSPLALADASTTRPKDLIATDQVFPDRVGEIYNVAYASAQRWYYAPRMTTDEVLLIKGWDSLDDGRARFTPHGAFQLPNTHEHAPARESIEARALVIIK